MDATDIQCLAITKLKRIAWLSKQDSTKKFDCLMHHFTAESLFCCFNSLDKNKAVGIDGVSWRQYAANVGVNIPDLVRRMKQMAYRPLPVKEVLIPKEGKPGATRPLGISVIEDKIVQKMVQQVLESIYEPLFLECSFGFRPGKSCHTAIQALQNHLFRNEIQTVIDIDLKNFFGTIDHELLEGILREKIQDARFMAYIKRMFKAGVLSEGELRTSDEGVPQGSVCSPIMSNIFAHYAIDLWIKDMIKPWCKGNVSLFRYADDAVICCQLESDAQAIRKVLPKRLAKFKLLLNEEKTKLVPFNKRLARQGFKQGTFDFLGFTFYWGRSRSGYIIPKLETRGKTMKAKLKKVKEWWIKERHNGPLKEIWKIFVAKLRGHMQYYAVSHNYSCVYKFFREATRIAFKWLNRRSQRKSFTWERFKLFMKLNPLPQVKILHNLF
jgi:RNA-directed DNA polymerase